ncbi:MAG: class I SAM-dependent methyltransferase [bacterium]|nr:class I SAM-dependent methyltransferase [bacterium]
MNAYEDKILADAYAKLEFDGTYHLAYRDLPDIVARHVTGRKALDFGCGTGRSTRFLQRLGFDTLGVDISKDMIRHAVESDPGGDYRLIQDKELGTFEPGGYDLVSSIFTFDNIPTWERKREITGNLRRLLKPDGILISLVSTPEIYMHEWVSFSTRDFPENRYAKSGDIVKIIGTDIEDNRPVEDIIWLEEDYFKIFAGAGLELLQSYRPLAKESEPFEWVNETKIAPWVVYVLKPGEIKK